MSQVVDLEEYKEQLRLQEEHREPQNVEVAAIVGIMETGEEIVSVSVHKKDGEIKAVVHHLDCSEEPPVLESISLRKTELAAVIHALIEVDDFLSKEIE
jgi:hypothetical protein